ncbi:MAG: reprolysin-like metallopeptidase [Pseudomarimonas sp.]
MKVFGSNSALMACGLMIALTAPVTASDPRALGDFWTPMTSRPTQDAPRGSDEQWFALDAEAIERHLAVLPAADAYADNATSLPLALPAAHGELVLFEVSRSPVMVAELAARYPEIQTFQGVAADGSAARVRFELTPQGLSAMLFSGDGSGVRMLERAQGADVYVSFTRERSAHASTFTCGVVDHSDPLGTAKASPPTAGKPVYSEPASSKVSGPSLRTYRTAIAATGEYTATFGGSVALGLSGVVSTVNRVNQLYETELGLRLQLVANNDLLIYTDAGSDPYDTTNESLMLTQNINNLNAVIGSTNYDFGHVFYTGGGGVAGLGVICGSSKARGLTGLPNPNNDPFWVDYVAHEMGHQLNGPHTFNGGTGSCAGGNRSAANAWEVGSGSTVMAYAGICGGENLQANSDPFFHVGSLERIHTFVQTGAGSSCGAVTSTGNLAPLLTATPGATIPARTPFALTAQASDPNGDPLTYLWEQFDLGAQTNTTTVLLDNTTGPLFRSFDATSSPTRLFPRLENILSGTPTLGEVLPTTNRTLNFRVTARDNRAGGGGVQWTGTASPAVAQTTITVINTGTPFAVTTANTAVSWASGSSQDVTWDVAGTTAAPISCANVDIDFSLDRGLSFPISLAAATSNDGSHSITTPSQATSAGRIRVRCADNIFFDINNADVSITGGNAAPVLTLSGGSVAYTSNGPAVIVDAAAVISDSDSADFAGGTLLLTLTNNGEDNDRLELRNQGNGAGQIGISGATVSFGGVAIGSQTGGVGTVPLSVQFNASATPAAAQAVLRNVTYRSTRDIAGTLPRTVQARVSDGDGGSSVGATRTITIQINPNPFVFGITAAVAGNNVSQNLAVAFTVTFSKAVNLASVSSVDFDNAGTSAISIGAITQPQPNQLLVQVTPTTLGTLRLRLPASAVVLDQSGVAVPVPFLDDTTYTVVAPDTTAPLATAFANSATGAQVAARIAVNYTITFNEAIRLNGLQGSDFSNAGSSALVVNSFSLESPTSLLVRVTPVSTGTLILRISGAAISDLSGNPLVVPRTDSTTVTVTAASNSIFIGSFEGS